MMKLFKDCTCTILQTCQGWELNPQIEGTPIRVYQTHAIPNLATRMMNQMVEIKFK